MKQVMHKRRKGRLMKKSKKRSAKRSKKTAIVNRLEPCTIVPSVIGANPAEAAERFAAIRKHSKIIQLDIMDGKFVPHHSLDFPLLLPKKHSYEAHLMMNRPEQWIRKNGRKVDTIIIQVESCPSQTILFRAVALIKRMRKNLGVALNPETPLGRIIPILDDLDLVLVMTVHPGAYSGDFMPKTLNKVRALRRLRPFLDIEVDGGITPMTIGAAAIAGANRFVSGHYVISAKNPKSAISSLSYAVTESLRWPKRPQKTHHLQNASWMEFENPRV